MYFDKYRGNDKIGRAIIVNRPVGKSCPTNCPLLNNGCYAKKTEKRFDNARAAVEENMDITADDLVSLLDSASKQGKDIRVHERGEFLHDGKLDRPYLNAWHKALSLRPNHPHIWAYTHVYLKSIAKLAQPKVSVYASVHNEEDVKKAQNKGFKLFAWQVDIRKRKGGSPDVSKKLNLPILGETLVCPEQRLGRKKITCDKCRWCIEGKGNVVFLKT